jgi:hypothetical protein
MEPDVTVTQEFVAGALNLARKWQDHIEHYDHFHENSLTIVSNLDPTFVEGQRKEPAG